WRLEEVWRTQRRESRADLGDVAVARRGSTFRVRGDERAARRATGSGGIGSDVALLARIEDALAADGPGEGRVEHERRECQQQSNGQPRVLHGRAVHRSPWPGPTSGAASIGRLGARHGCSLLARYAVRMSTKYGRVRRRIRTFPTKVVANAAAMHCVPATAPVRTPWHVSIAVEAGGPGLPVEEAGRPAPRA